MSIKVLYLCGFIHARVTGSQKLKLFNFVKLNSDST